MTQQQQLAWGNKMSNIRQYLPQVAKPNKESAPFANAFLDGADEIVAQLEAYSEYAQNQFFFTTADAEYVFKLAARNGFYLPRNAGLNIEGLKPLAPLMINQPKTTLALLIKILEIYFSESLSRPNIVCAQPEPYRLRAGDDFIVKTQKTTHRLTIDEKLFSNAKRVTASELSTYINSVQDHYLATVFFDRNTNKNKIKITANGSGPSEIIQVMGGTLQNLLLFPDIVNTTNTTQTKWLVSKSADYSDIVTFKYIDGPVPDVFNVSIGDIATFRNQFDVGESGLAYLNIVDELGNEIIDNNGAYVVVEVNLIQGNYSVLNGSFDVIEVGYDYFTIRNKYLRLPVNNEGVLVQLSSRDVIFTKNLAHRSYDQPSFSYLSEMTNDQVTVTVPAVPPIVKRFLEGSWHIYGAKHLVTGFTRYSLQINPITNIQLPETGNVFCLQSTKITTDYLKKKFKINAINPSNGIISIDSSGEYAVFPYTTPFLINSNNPFYCDFDSDLVEIDFSYEHGLFLNSVIVINNSQTNPESGISLNGSWKVNKIISPTKALIKINTKNIANPPSVTGSLYSLGNKKYRLSYTSSSILNLSKLTSVGKEFKFFDNGTSTISNNYVWSKLKTRIHTITSVGTNSIEFETLEDWSVLPNETIAVNVKTQTSLVNWGGSTATSYFNKNDPENIEMLSNLELVIADYIKPKSSLFLGSYVYDPQGVYYRFLPSAAGTKAVSQVLKGESGVIVSVSDTTDFTANGGYVIFDYGTKSIEGPVKYLALSGNQIIIDPSYAFKKTHLVEATVREVKQLEPFAPTENGKQYQPFLTGTSSARDSFFEILKSVISAGVFIREDVLFPELRFSDNSVKPYE